MTLSFLEYNIPLSVLEYNITFSFLLLLYTMYKYKCLCIARVGIMILIHCYLYKSCRVNRFIEKELDRSRRKLLLDEMYLAKETFPNGHFLNVKFTNSNNCRARISLRTLSVAVRGTENFST